MAWKDEIVEALKALGGKAKYEDIYAYIEKNTARELTAQWKASVRNAMETYSSDSYNFNNKEDLFFSVGGIGNGVWGLRNFSEVTAQISRGINKGKQLLPHRYADDKYVVSETRFEEDYIRVDNMDEAINLIKDGYKLRMFAPELTEGARLISPGSIEINLPEAKKQPIKDQLRKLAKLTTLDAVGEAPIRKEQALLRALLLQGRDTANCTICGELFPRDLLVAAHIKKRSACDEDEKSDFDAIVTLMCKLGCDDLYEKGYIYVQNGKVHKRKKTGITPYLKEYISKLEGNAVSDWEESADYYAWHMDNVAKVSSTS